MGKKNVYINDIEGLFPGADSVEDFWRMIENGEVAPLKNLDAYWGSAQKGVDEDLVMKAGHILNDNEVKSGSRQVLLGQKVLERLHVRMPRSSKRGLILATEWTDPSFYKAELGELNQEESYNVERQLLCLGSSLGIQDKCSLMAVDTACASGIYAVYMAREWLNYRGFDDVVVLGLNAYLHQFLYKGFSKLGALSSTERLSSFSNSADGIVPGEAVCAIALSHRYKGAMAEVDGIGLSCDGREGSAFSPGLDGQLEAYRRAYLDSSIGPKDVSYIEAHGTATQLGDKTELRSLKNFFGERQKTKPLYLGASKANFGHTLAASGVLALIKSTLMIKNKRLPPLKVQGESILSKNSPLKISSVCASFLEEELHVGVSSFGFGGSNGHLILSPPLKGLSTKKALGAPRQLYLYDYESLNSSSLSQVPEVLSKIPLGPKMQKRIDPFQRHAMALASKIVKRYTKTGEKALELSCIFMNNLGGKLSIDFENKFKNRLEYPELSLEAVSSTLPSMLSGNIAQVFDLRGTHMLLSSSVEGLSQAFESGLAYSYESGSPVLLGIAHGNFSRFEKGDEVMAMFLISHKSKLKDKKPLACVEIEERRNGEDTNTKVVGEATGLAELIDTLIGEERAEGQVVTSSKTLKVKCYKNKPSGDLSSIIHKESEMNKKVVLGYLALQRRLSEHSEMKTQRSYGDFIRDISRDAKTMSARLIVPEEHKYFYDHPLDHVPGIAVAHGCEELLCWESEGQKFPSRISIRFKKFIEKDIPCFLQTQTKSHPYNIKIIQNDIVLGHIELEMGQFESPLEEKKDHAKYTKEDKKMTHKHDEKNVLVSSLDRDSQSCTALPLEYVQHQFFLSLMSQRPSLLYYLEVTRQFVMLMAHLVKNIPLESKMNLISVDVNIKEWVRPPFKLRLINFTIQKTDDFSLASIEVEYLFKEKCFGTGVIKAQVVDKEYYQKQRKGTGRE